MRAPTTVTTPATTPIHGREASATVMATTPVSTAVVAQDAGRRPG
jgi:hypothetical protein